MRKRLSLLATAATAAVFLTTGTAAGAAPGMPPAQPLPVTPERRNPLCSPASWWVRFISAPGATAP